MSGYRDLTQANPTTIHCKSIYTTDSSTMAALISAGGITSNSDINARQNVMIDGLLNVAKATDPVIGKLGDMYFNTTSNKWVYCTGSAWVPM